MIEISRRPYAYRTSHRLDELEFVQPDGTQLKLLLKDLRRSELGPARRVKPRLVHNPRREVEAYRVLADANLGTPICHNSGKHWLLLEKVQGVELWQVGELATWVDVARWLAAFHDHFASKPPSSVALLDYDAPFFRLWPERARSRHPELRRVLSGYDRVIKLLISQRRTLIHGEFYASNILVAGSRIAPVDWEMAGMGPGVLDLAALLSGWGDSERTAIAAGYGDVSSEVLSAAQLHLALQWLGWSADWTPPPEHARDWLVEALAAAERLGL